VENLVKFVKGNFLAGRSFYDEADLAEQCQEWLRQVNDERPSDATGEPPTVLLEQEQPHFGPLPEVAKDYGFFDCVVVSREGLVTIETNRYSVPAHLMGRALTARIHSHRIELFADQELVATHVRLPAQNARVIDPAHFEAAFVVKLRGRVMVYRDWLCSLSAVATHYVHEIAHKRRRQMNRQMIALYDLAQEIGKADAHCCAGIGSRTADVRRRVPACDCESPISSCVCRCSASPCRQTCALRSTTA
jgi:hypothetical protein